MSEPPIQKIGRYEIEREIGQGGMAVVYKAFDPRLERPVAIKLIRMNAFSADAFSHVRERFEREAKALARLDHPNILRVHDFGDHDGAPYLVMDYIEGSTLKELKKPVRVDTAVKLLTPIADALEYVHAQGLLHRDVKPSNIMITQNGRVILTDFGIVKSLEEDGDLHTLTATGVGIGTPEYMSPEQGRGMKVDARSDMYSLSIVFYELITGRKPFTADTPVNILLKQISEPLPDPRQFVPEISGSVKKFLDRAAAKDPEDRYPTTKEYLLDLEGLRLQAQTNRAMGQANSGFQSLPRKTESTASSLEIGKTGLDEVREKVNDLPTVQPNQNSFTQPEPARNVPPKRVPWVALAAGLVAVAVLIGGYFGVQNLGEQSVKRTQAAANAQIAMLTADAGRATAEIEAITATKAKEAQAMTGTAEVERTAAQATFEEDKRATEQMETHAAGETQTVIAIAQTATQIAKYQVGDIIKFGHYEQDNNKNNGAEEIEWRILALDGDTALIVSVMGLDAKPYNKAQESITWEDCTLRAWLNHEFYNGAFSDSERAAIELTHVVNEDNPTNSTKGGNDTEDNVFLLSIAEAKQYFKDNNDRNLKPTKYAIENGAWTQPDNGKGWWWLRSPGGTQSCAAGVDSVGFISFFGSIVNYDEGLVRPALRVNLKLFESIPESPMISNSQIPIPSPDVNIDSSNFQVGDIIKFGHYEQDNNLSNGAEEIEWRVLALEGDTALVVSVMGLDAKPYNKEFILVTWEDCTLRAWLNNEFYQEAFSESERKKIEITNNTTGNSEVYPIITDQVTEDYIFLLSNEEVETYLDSEEDNLLPTLYTWKKWDTAKTPYNEICCWWLRAPGNIQPITSWVYSHPYLQRTYDAPDNFNVVRPALRINLGK